MEDSVAIAKITSWGISMIALAVWYKTNGVYGWDTYLWIGSVVLLLVGTYILGSVFDNLGFTGALGASSFFIGLMMIAIQPLYSLVFFGFLILIIIVKIGGT